VTGPSVVTTANGQPGGHGHGRSGSGTQDRLSPGGVSKAALRLWPRRRHCRWRPGRDDAGTAVFALYGLRLQAEGISPGPVEPILTITDRHGYFFGQLDLDAGDAQFMVDAISGMLTLQYGPWKSEDIKRLRAEHRASPHG
jgi:hypothetical protein